MADVDLYGITASWIAKRIRDREKYNGKREDGSGPTAVYILDDMQTEVDILVRDVSKGGDDKNLLGVYQSPTLEMIKEDVLAFYGVS